jgi:hypothetical protein
MKRGKETGKDNTLDMDLIKKLSKEIKDIDPVISDDFQIGPDGAYEHIERDKSVMTIKRMLNKK